MTNNLSPSTQQQAEQRIDPMEWLFGQLHGMYGKAFTDKFGSGATVNDKDSGIENTKLVWHEKIRANGLRMPDIKRGLASCNKFVPTWPEFLEFCRPTPNVDAALAEAVQQLHARNDGKDQWSHPAIYWAAQKVGYYEMTTLSTSALKPRFSAALDDVMRQDVIKPVPEIVQAPRLPAPTPVSNEDVAKAKAMIAGYVNEQTKANGAPVDGLRWAKRIIARIQRGDTTVSMHQLREAEQALQAGSFAGDYA